MIRIITDSTCDITQKEAIELGITVIPLTILFGDQEYQDGVTLTTEHFYQKLANTDILPVTSQIPPAVFEDTFSKYQNTDDTIIGIFLSSELSGTFQSAMIAKLNLEQDNIYLIDSKNVSIGTALIVREAVKMRDQGFPAESIVNTCNDLVPRVKTVAVAQTLQYLKMGGRLSAQAAMIGSLLHITPVIEVCDGRIQLASKLRGKKATLHYFNTLISDSPADPFRTMVFGHASAPENLRLLSEELCELTVHLNTAESSIGCAVGTHLGPGAFGIAYVPEANHQELANETQSIYCA